MCRQMTDSIDGRYPHLATWVKTQGWIEVGHAEFSSSFIRVLDDGGMVWEGDEGYASLDDALLAAEHAVIERCG